MTNLLPNLCGLFNNFVLLDSSRFLTKTINSQIVDKRNGRGIGGISPSKLDLVIRLTSSKNGNTIIHCSQLDTVLIIIIHCSQLDTVLIIIIHCSQRILQLTGYCINNNNTLQSTDTAVNWILD